MSDEQIFDADEQDTPDAPDVEALQAQIAEHQGNEALTTELTRSGSAALSRMT